MWTAVATFSGLTPNGDYWMDGRTGTCEAPDLGVWTTQVDVSATGNAFELYHPNPQASTATVFELKPAAASDPEDPALVCVQIR